MTIKQYIKENGWEYDCESKPCRAMSVQVGFFNDEGKEDETEFDIAAYKVNELANLFDKFCEENGFPKNTVFAVVIVQMAKTMEELV